MQIEHYSRENIVKSGIYVILYGTVVIQNPDLEAIPKIYRKANSQFIKGLKHTDEILLEAGMIFGEIFKFKNYELVCSENCSCAVLLDENYSKIKQTYDETLAAKIKFIKDLGIFKNWSQLALRNASIAFEKKRYCKGNIVYKENDPTNEIFVVSHGEFILTQKFLLNSDANNEDEHVFGTGPKMKQNRLKKEDKMRDLQVVVKQKGDIFGFNEFFSKKNTREFTCSCISTTGELFVMNEKEFTKRLSHPETIRQLENQNNIFKKWTDSRILNLKFLEGYKNKISHTPKSHIKIIKKIIQSPSSNIKIVQSVTPQPRLPVILNNMINSRKKSQISKRKNELSFLIFPTEINPDSSYRKLRTSKRY